MSYIKDTTESLHSIQLLRLRLQLSKNFHIMMKIIFIASCVVLAVQAASYTEKETQEALRVLKEDSDICAKSSEVDPKLVADAYKGIFADDDKFKEYLYCFSKRQDYQDENGLLKKHVMFKKLYMELLDAELAEKITEKCLVNLDTPQNTALEATKCYFFNNPKCCFGL